MSTAFREIKIVDLDVDMTGPSEMAPGLRLVHFTLSGVPPSEWVHLFEEERRSPRHSMWRRAWVEGKHIVIDCVPTEIESYHLNDLKTDVENCNKKYIAWQSRAQAEIANRSDEQQQERQKLEELRSKLKFD